MNKLITACELMALSLLTGHSFEVRHVSSDHGTAIELEICHPGQILSVLTVLYKQRQVTHILELEVIQFDERPCELLLCQPGGRGKLFYSAEII